MHKKHSRAQIVATIGPASKDLKSLTAMISHQMDIARLNFSHGTYEEHAAYIKNNDFYYIISLQESDYFGSESEFKGTFFNVIKRFEFLD